MKVLVATLEGDYAHFRIPETTRENLTYPFPPRTALIGMLAAIRGDPKNSYWEEDHPLRDLNVGVKILNSLKRTFLKVNYIRVKETVSLSKGTKIYLPAKYSRGMNAPFKMNLMKDVKYRIFISSPNEALLEELKERLKNRKFVFPPYLGHANLLAHWEYEGFYDLEPIYGNEPLQCKTVIPFSALDMQKVSYDLSGTPVLYNMPMAMKAASPKKPLSIWNIIVDRVDSVFLVRPDEPFSAVFKNGKAFRVNGEIIAFL